MKSPKEPSVFKQINRQLLYYLLFVAFLLIAWRVYGWSLLLYAAIAALVYCLFLFGQLIILYINRKR